MRPPKIIKPYVKSFCAQVAKGNPVFIPLRPLAHKPINECVNIVPEHIVSNGGEEVRGWAIWEWPKVLIEAEFHTVWKSPQGEIIDLTPKPKSLDSILFLPDPKVKYVGRQIDNIRKPLTRHKDIKRLIWLHEQKFLELNKGDLADYYGPIAPTGRLMKLHQEMVQLHTKLARKHGLP